MILNRRNFVVGTAALAAGASVSVPFFLPKYHSDRRARRSRVAILNVERYSQRVDEVLSSGLRLFRIDVQGKTVVLKPNLVDYIPGNAINTHPTLVLAAAESFRRMGAKRVVVAELLSTIQGTLKSGEIGANLVAIAQVLCHEELAGEWDSNPQENVN